MDSWQDRTAGLAICLAMAAMGTADPKGSNTTVVDRRLAAEIRVSGSGSAEREIDVVFAIGTSAVDAQRRAIRAREGE